MVVAFIEADFVGTDLAVEDRLGFGVVAAAIGTNLTFGSFPCHATAELIGNRQRHAVAIDGFEWDPDKEQIIGNHQAARMLRHAYREPWRLPS